MHAGRQLFVCSQCALRRSLNKVRSAVTRVESMSSAQASTRATKKLMQMLLRAAWVEDIFRCLTAVAQDVTRGLPDSKQLHALLQALGLPPVSLTPDQVDVAFQGPEGNAQCFLPSSQCTHCPVTPFLQDFRREASATYFFSHPMST